MMNFNSMDKKYVITAGITLAVFTLSLVSLIIITKIKQDDNNVRPSGIITDSDPEYSVEDLAQPLSGTSDLANPQLRQNRSQIYSLDNNVAGVKESSIKINPETGEVDLSELKKKEGEPEKNN